MVQNKVKIDNHKWLKTVLSLAVLLIFASYIGCKSKVKEEDKTETVTTDVIDVHEANSTIAEYISFVSNDKNKMTLDHAYTNEALLKLTSATKAMADEVGFNVKGDLDKAKECADNITKNPFEISHADEIRKAADILSNVLQNIQQAKYPSLSNDAVKVKSAAIAINPDTLTLDQRDAVKTFFANASDLLEKMN